MVSGGIEVIQVIQFAYCSVSDPEKIWGLRLGSTLVVWSTFLNTKIILLIYIILHTFSHFRIQGSSLFTW